MHSSTFCLSMFPFFPDGKVMLRIEEVKPTLAIVRKGDDDDYCKKRRRHYKCLSRGENTRLQSWIADEEKTDLQTEDAHQRKLS